MYLYQLFQKCSTAGTGIAPNHVPEELAGQVCFGIDYDFGSHKCYFHTDETLCPELVTVIPTPVQLVEAPSVVNILLCEWRQYSFHSLYRSLFNNVTSQNCTAVDYITINCSCSKREHLKWRS